MSMQETMRAGLLWIKHELGHAFEQFLEALQEDPTAGITYVNFISHSNNPVSEEPKRGIRTPGTKTWLYLSLVIIWHQASGFQGLLLLQETCCKKGYKE